MVKWEEEDAIDIQKDIDSMHNWAKTQLAQVAGGIGGVAQLVVASSLMLKGIGFDPRQGKKYSQLL